VRRPLILLAAAALLALVLVIPAVAAPTVTLDTPADGTSTNDKTPTFTGTAGTPGNTDTVTVNVYSGSSASGSPFETVTTTPGPTAAWTVDASPELPDGTYTAQAEQSDGSGTGMSSPHTFTVDTQAPSSTASSAALTNQSSFSVSYTSSDNTGGAGLDHVDLYAKGPSDVAYAKVATDPSPGASGSFNYNAPQGDGDYSFYTRAVDKAGNVEDAPAGADTTTKLDTARPSVTLIGPADGSSTNDTTPPPLRRRRHRARGLADGRGQGLFGSERVRQPTRLDG
jgi:large repetitive protein